MEKQKEFSLTPVLMAPISEPRGRGFMSQLPLPGEVGSSGADIGTQGDKCCSLGMRVVLDVEGTERAEARKPKQEASAQVRLH